MIKSNKQIVRALEQRVVGKILLQSLLKGGVFLLVVFILYVLAGSFFSQKVWKGNEFLYPLLHFADDNATLIFVLFRIFGLSAIFCLEIKKIFFLLYHVLDAVAQVYDHSEEMIVLPPELSEVETQMNQLKWQIARSGELAREAEQRKNDLVVYLAHDLKTPLTSVIGYLSLLKEEKQISEETRERYIAISLQKAERLEELINEFFDITRFNLSHLELSCSEVNFTRMIEQLHFEFQPMLAEKNLTCRLEKVNDVTLNCDGDKIQRVLDNLLRNAVNYSYPGTEILIQMSRAENQVLLRIENQGDTIPEGKINHLFEQFFRLDSSRGSSTGGSGLGLAIAKQIVEQHGGGITAGSENNRIWFTVALPV